MDFVEGIRELCPKTTMVLQVIGALIILRKLFTLVSRMYKLIRKRKNLPQRYGRNSWVFITGSSQGIGKALALSFAKQGFNVIISARTLSKLQQAQKQIKNKYPDRQVKILVADYQRAVNWEYISGLLDEISNLDISIVVNNVGMDTLDKFVDIDPEHIKNMITLNCYSMAFINRYFLPIFEKHAKSGKKCAIINVSSIAGTIPLSYFQIYAATKAFVDRLSQSLKYEHPQIDILTIRPAQVSTPMTGNKQTDIFTIKADQCSEGILDQLGHDSQTYGHWRHQLQGWLYEVVHIDVFMWIYQRIFIIDELARRKQKKNR